MNALASLVGHGVLEIKKKTVIGIIARICDVLFLKYLFPRCSNKYLNFALTETS